MEANDSSTARDWYILTINVSLFVTVVFYSITILIQLSWIVYLVNNIRQESRIVSRLVRNGFQYEDKNLATGRKNKLLLHKYLLMNLIFEMSIVVLLVINSIIRCIPITEKISQFDMKQSIRYPLIYHYMNYISVFIEIVLIQCFLESLNLTTLFVKDVYLQNSTHNGM